MPGSVTSDLTRQQQMQGNLAATQDPDVVEKEIVDESQTVEKPITADDAPSVWNENIHTLSRREQAATTFYKTDPRSGDMVGITGRSIAPDVLQGSVSANADTVVTAARADIEPLEMTVNGQHVQVPDMSLRQIRLNQDKYPDFLVLGMPNPANGKYNLHVTDRQTGYALNPEQLVMFVNNVVRPALAS